MQDEYIIINRTTLEKRIEELENKRDECSDPRDYSDLCGKIHQLEQVLLFSTPLIPEIEKAFNAGSERGEHGYGNANNKQDYITNLNLDI